MGHRHRRLPSVLGSEVLHLKESSAVSVWQ